MSLYPFGLNDQIAEIGNMTRQNLLSFNFIDPFYRYPEVRQWRSHGIRRSNKNRNVTYDIDKVINHLKLIYNQFGLKKYVDAIKGTNNKLLSKILSKILLNTNQFEGRFVDIISAYIGHCRKYNKDSKAYDEYNIVRGKLEYSSRILDIINVPAIISSKDIKSKIPEEYDKCKVEVIYRYNKPIGSRICNYNKFLENITEQDIMNNSPCICERNNNHNKVRDFIYSPVGHVVTGNINMLDKIGNYDQLKKIMKYGYKYRLQNFSVNWQKIKRDIMMLIESLKVKIIDKNRGNNNDLNDWEEAVKCRINNKIRSLQRSHNLNSFLNNINQKFLINK